MLSYSGSGFPIIMPPEDGDALADYLEAIYPDEFCVSASFDADFVDELCFSGFIPMALVDESAGELLIPKLHTVRSLLEPRGVEVTRTARRASGRYCLGLDERFDEVLGNCVAVHGDDWLRPPLLECWKELFATRSSRRSSFSSMELYEEGELVAGEIGVFAGGSYTSLTGYYSRSGAGTVQLAATARYLEAIGASLWDLGMPLDYKRSLGARNVSRAEFLELFRAARGKPIARAEGAARMAARELIDRPT
jgi:Leu/Phe-tRNA-protein transferase